MVMSYLRLRVNVLKDAVDDLLNESFGCVRNVRFYFVVELFTVGSVYPADRISYDPFNVVVRHQYFSELVHPRLELLLRYRVLYDGLDKAGHVERGRKVDEVLVFQLPLHHCILELEESGPDEARDETDAQRLGVLVPFSGRSLRSVGAKYLSSKLHHLLPIDEIILQVFAGRFQA